MGHFIGDGMNVGSYSFLTLFAVAGVVFAITPLALAWLWARVFSPRKSGPSKNANCALYHGGIRLFGSWRKAIEAAGLNYDLLLKQSRAISAISPK